MKNHDIKYYKLKAMYKVLLVGAILIMATMAAGRSTYFKEKNDTLMYQNHYSCMARHSTEFCESKIGNSSDPAYTVLVKILSTITNGSAFWLFLFILAAIYISTSFFFAEKLSPIPIISILFLISDFRFWEGFSNALRHGLALSIMLLFISLGVSMRSEKVVAMRWLSALSHKSIIPVLLVPINRKFNALFLLPLIPISYILAKNISPFLDAVGLSEYHKILYYTRHENEISYSSIGMPAHYILVMLLSTFACRHKENNFFNASTLMLITLTALSIILSPLGMGYRMSMYMTPFISINIAFIIILLEKRIKKTSIVFRRNHAISVVRLSVVALMLLIFIYYIDRVAYHLQ